MHFLSESRLEGGFDVPVWEGYDTVFDHLVSFNTGGYGSAATQRLSPDGLAEVPTPAVSGQKLVGWFTDDTFTTEFNFGLAPTENVTAFAQWTAADPTVLFDSGLCVGGGAAGAQVTITVTEADPGSPYGVGVESTPTRIAAGTARRLSADSSNRSARGAAI